MKYYGWHCTHPEYDEYHSNQCKDCKGQCYKFVFEAKIIPPKGYQILCPNCAAVFQWYPLKDSVTVWCPLCARYDVLGRCTFRYEFAVKGVKT